MSKIGEHEEDPILLFSFLKGDNNAFSSIYNKYVDELFAYGIGLGFERETLKDAIQDTFFKFYTNKENIVDVTNLPFLIEPSVLDELVANEDKAAIETEIKNLLEILTDRQKEAVYLRFIQELEYEEVANLLDMTAPAVRKLISRAIKRMRDEKF